MYFSSTWLPLCNCSDVFWCNCVLQIKLSFMWAVEWYLRELSRQQHRQIIFDCRNSLSIQKKIFLPIVYLQFSMDASRSIWRKQFYASIRLVSNILYWKTSIMHKIKLIWRAVICGGLLQLWIKIIINFVLTYSDDAISLLYSDCCPSAEETWR